MKDSSVRAGTGYLVFLRNFLIAVLFITVLFRMVPFQPRMPATGLDASCLFAHNQAVAQGLDFGEDFVFTFGPFAAIYNRTYHPATDGLMIGGSLLLALLFGFSLYLILRGKPWYWTLALLLAMTGFRQPPDTLLFAIPLTAGLAIYILSTRQTGKDPQRKFTTALIVFLLLPFGLLPLIKGSLLPLCAAVMVLMSGWLWFNRKGISALLVLGVPVASSLACWMAAGQHLSSWPAYLSSMMAMSSGYTGAMSAPGPLSEILLYLVASLILLTAIWTLKEKRSDRGYLLLLFFLFLFLSFKAGFVRHDAHAVTAASALLLGALLLAPLLRFRIALPLLLIVVTAWHHIDNHYGRSSLKHFGNSLKATYVKPWQGLRSRMLHPQLLITRYDSTLRGIRERARLPLFPGTSDIYSARQSSLIASGNTWSPRPVFQSYAVFNPVLAAMNRDHLLSSNAPGHIFFGMEPIDHRFPALEDGASWPVLLHHYRPRAITDSLLILDRLRDIPDESSLTPIIERKCRMGIPFVLPVTDTLLFADIMIQPTILGRLADLLYKPGILQITLEMENGTRKGFRLVPGMAAAGFLLSPLVENPHEFSFLYEGAGKLDEKIVKTMTITPETPEDPSWQDTYRIRISRLDVVRQDSVPITNYSSKTHDLTTFEVKNTQ